MMTERCVRCLKPAKFWTGWVARGKRKVTAGWCSTRCCRAWTGYAGNYEITMGRQRTEPKEHA